MPSLAQITANTDNTRKKTSNI